MVLIAWSDPEQWQQVGRCGNVCASDCVDTDDDGVNDSYTYGINTEALQL